MTTIEPTLNKLFSTFYQNVTPFGCASCPWKDGTTHERDCQHPDCTPIERIEVSATPTHYVHWNGAAFFVKEAEFFISQGGLVQPWGRAWTPVIATSIEHARSIANEMHTRGYAPAPYYDPMTENYCVVCHPAPFHIGSKCRHCLSTKRADDVEQ